MSPLPEPITPALFTLPWMLVTLWTVIGATSFSLNENCNPSPKIPFDSKSKDQSRILFLTVVITCSSTPALITHTISVFCPILWANVSAIQSGRGKKGFSPLLLIFFIDDIDSVMWNVDTIAFNSASLKLTTSGTQLWCWGLYAFNCDWPFLYSGTVSKLG